MKRRRILIAALLVAAVTGFAWLLLRPREPVYQGKSLSFLLNQTYLTEHWIRHAGDIALYPRVDSNAVPFLLKALEYHENAFQVRYSSAWAKLPNWMRNRLPHPVNADNVRRNADFMLGDKAIQTPATIPALIRVAKEDTSLDVRTVALDSLLQIGSRNEDVVKCFFSLMFDKQIGPVAQVFLNQIDRNFQNEVLDANTRHKILAEQAARKQ